MTTLSAASTLGDSWNRQLEGYSESFAPQPMAPQPMARGMRFSPPSLAALDLPQGKVLMVVDDAVVALDLQRLLREAGYRVVGPVTTVSEVQRRIERGDIDCAIVAGEKEPSCSCTVTRRSVMIDGDLKMLKE